MRRAVTGCGLVACGTAALFAACGGGAARAPGQRSSLTANECAPATDANRRTPASLVVAMTADPAVAPDAEATVRIAGDLSRSDITVPVAGGMQLELPPGVYEVRVSLRGYDVVAKRITLTGGCAAEITATLKR